MRGHLDLDPHPGIGEAADLHGGGRSDLAQPGPQRRPAGFEIFAIGEQIPDPDNVAGGAAGFAQNVIDRPDDLLSLSDHVVGDGHRGVVESGRPRDMHPVAVDDRP